MANKWKTIAIIFIVLFTLETLYFAWATYVYMQEEKKTLECYYVVCEEYPEAMYENGVCFCYDYTMLGDLDVVKTEVM